MNLSHGGGADVFHGSHSGTLRSAPPAPNHRTSDGLDEWASKGTPPSGHELYRLYNLFAAASGVLLIWRQRGGTVAVHPKLHAKIDVAGGLEEGAELEG